LGFSWSAFLVYVVALMLCVGGGFICLIASGHPAFLGPILIGLFYFYLAWEAVVEDDSVSPTPPKGHNQHG
jgi:hypothetical protein